MAEEQKKPKKTEFNLQQFMKTRRFLVMAGGLALAAGALVLLAIFPNIQHILEQVGELQAEEKKLDSLLNKQQALSDVESTDLYQFKDQIQAILPSTKPVLSVLKELDKLSAETGVIVAEFGVEPGQISTDSATPQTKSTSASRSDLPKDVEYVETAITVVGTLSQVNEFLKGINLLVPLTESGKLSMKSTSISGLGDGTVPLEQQYEVGLTLVTYYSTVKPQVKADQDLPRLERIDQAFINQLSQFRYPTNDARPLSPAFGGKENLFE